MKRISVIAIIVIASLNIVNAQGFHFGAMAGFNLANLTDIAPFPNVLNHEATTAMIPGFNFGGVVNFKISNHFSIDVIPQYSTCGTKINDDIPAATWTSGIYTITTSAISFTNTYNLSYLQIPVLAKYKFNNGINIFAGPYIGFLVSSMANSTAYSYTQTALNNMAETINNSVEVTNHNVPATSYNNSSSTNNIDAGATAGVGYQLICGLGINIKYSLGLTNIYKPGVEVYPPFEPINTPAWGKNGVLGISVCYMFGMNK